MRIALVCDWYLPRRGGIETHLDALATRLAARGHEVQVITSTPGASSVNGVRVHRLDVPRLPFAQVAGRPVVGEVERLIEHERIDVVHSHVSIVSPVALAGALSAHRAGKANVLTFHSFVPGTPLLAGLVGRMLGSAGWRAVYTAVSDHVAREVAPFAPVPFVRLPNAIDGSFWTPGGAPAASPPVRLLYAGRLQSKKRPLLLLRVLRELRRLGPDVAWQMTIAGEGRLGAALRRGVHELGLTDRVDFPGWLDAPQLRDRLRASHVFLSTAARESFGLASLEARSVGVPVVAVRDSAVADFIVGGESGLLADDDVAFAAAVTRLVRDGALRDRMAAFNRRTAVRYDWAEALDLHERVYARAASLLRGHG
jgi:glycosyltransferase involved in cell wall biosynthesis